MDSNEYNVCEQEVLEHELQVMSDYQDSQYMISSNVLDSIEDITSCRVNRNLGVQEDEIFYTIDVVHIPIGRNFQLCKNHLYLLRSDQIHKTFEISYLNEDRFGTLIKNIEEATEISSLSIKCESMHNMNMFQKLLRGKLNTKSLTNLHLINFKTTLKDISKLLHNLDNLKNLTLSYCQINGTPSD